MSTIDRLVPDAVQLLGVVTGLITAAMVLGLLCAKRGAALRHGIWLCALLGTLFSPLIVVVAGRAGLRMATISWPAARPDGVESPTISPLLAAGPDRPGLWPMPAIEMDSTPVPRDDRSQPAEPLALPPLEGGIEERPSPVPADLQPGAGPSTAAAVPQERAWPVFLGPFALTLWAVGALALLARFLRGLHLLRALRRSVRPIESKTLDDAREQARLSLGTGQMPRIAVSPSVSSPVALGVFRPLVILPEGLVEALDPQSLRDVLIHESAHILRRDPLVGLLQRLVEMLYWPHPLVHLLNRRLARAREEICDNFVLQQTAPCCFARTLLALAERTGNDGLPLGSLPLMNARWKLEDRVAGLLDPKRKPLTRINRASLASVAALSIATGVALAAVRIESANQSPAPESEVGLGASAPADFAALPKPRRITGRAIDARSGKPIPNASVRLERSWKTAGPVKTGAEGTFAIEVRDQLLLDEELIATTTDGLLQGTATLHEPVDSPSLPSAVEIRLEPCRTVNVLVLDVRQAPVSEATVEVIADWGSIGSARTDAKGRATVRFPSGRKIDQIIAVKPGVGFDYFENYESWPSPGKIEVPASVSLVLDGARTGRIKAIDSSGQPIAGEGFYLLAIKKRGKLSYATGGFRSCVSRTDADGMATFDWLPSELEDPVQVMLWPAAWHAPARPAFPVGDLHKETRVRLVRKVLLRGKVLGPDGTPQAGIRVEAGGVGEDAEDEYDQGWTRTDADGRYAIAVAPEHSYMVGVRDARWAARSLTNIVPRREGETFDLPDLRLIRGTIVEGRLTRAPGNQPIEDEWVSLQENGDPLPSDFKPFTWEGLEWLTRSTRTDRNGRYEFRVGPGSYELRLGVSRTEKLRIGTEETLTRDLSLGETDEPGRHQVEGLVRERSGTGLKPVGGAMVQAVSTAQQIVARTDEAGKFAVSARHGPLVVFARNRDGSRAGFAELRTGERSISVDLGEASSISGRVIDFAGRPRVNLLVRIWVQSPFRQGPHEKFHLETRTDSQGRYRIPGLAIGAGCELWVVAEREMGTVRSGVHVVSSFMVKSPAPMVQPDVVLPISLEDGGANDKNTQAEHAAAASRPPTVASGPSRSEIADLIRAIGRDPVSHELVDRIAAMHHARVLWSRDFGRMKQIATDPQEVGRLDVLSKDVQGKPIDTLTLLRAAMLHHKGYDDAMMKQFLREWTATESGMPLKARGTVVDEETKQPIPFPRVVADEAIASSDQNGRFELTVRTKPESRGITLWVEADGHASGEVLVRNNEDMRIALRRDVPFSGKVVDQEGKPVAGAEVRASVHRALMVLGDTKPEEFRGGSHGLFQVRTDGEGRFSFQGVPVSGFAASQVRKLEEAFLQLLARDRAFNNPRWPFLIKVRDVQGKALIDATFCKRAKDQRNADTFNATIFARRAELQFDLTRNVIHLKLESAEVQNFDKSDALLIDCNSLEIPLPLDPEFAPARPPIYLEVTHPNFQTSNTEASAPTRADAAPLIRLQPGLAVSGQVLDKQGKPIGEAWVHVRDTERGGYLATAFTDRETGMFRTPSILKPGSYTVVVQSDTHAAAWRSITVEKALPAQRFVLEPGGFITGKVVTASGKPVAGAAVGWVQPMSAERAPSRVLELQAMTATDADGKFRLGPLPEGEFQITALAQSPRRLAQVTARTNTAKIIKLAPDK